MVFINYYAYGAPALIFEAAHHSAPTIDLHSTPLAEMFSVSAEYALSCVLTEAARCNGKRGALCISS